MSQLDHFQRKTINTINGIDI